MHRFLDLIADHRKHILIASTFLSFVYFFWGVNSWRYSYVGDVWAFYEFAADIYYNNFRIYPFSFNGVFEHSSLGSIYQALFFNFFGVSNAAWRLSNVILIIPISYFFYRWLRLYFDWKIAIISTILLQASFYLSTFFKIGYLNPQALALFVIALYYAALSGLYPTKRNGFILGTVLGISFYIYIGPIFPLLIWPYLLPLIKGKRKTILSFMVCLLLTYAAFVALVLPTAESLANPTGKTALHREYDDPRQMLTNIGNNFLVFYKAFPITPTHFIPFAYLDSVSQVFALAGTFAVVCLLYVKRYLYLFLTYLSTCIMLGLTSPYTTPPTSRGMFLVIFGFVFAGIGIYLLAKSKYAKSWLTIPVVLLIVGLNVYLGQFASFQKIGYTGMALIMQQLDKAKSIDKNQVNLVLSEYQSINLYMYDMPTMQKAFGLDAVHLKIVRPFELQCSQIDDSNFVVFSYDVDAINKLNAEKCNYEVLATSILHY